MGAAGRPLVPHAPVPLNASAEVQKALRDGRASGFNEGASGVPETRPGLEPSKPSILHHMVDN